MTGSARSWAAGRLEHFVYELLLDENGEKISKSKGNGLTIDEWLTYAGPESLSYFMYQKPRSAKRLYFDVIPKAVDEYHQQPGHSTAATPRRGWRIRSGISTKGSRRRPTWWWFRSMLLALRAPPTPTTRCSGPIRRYAPGPR